jgi:iron complex outermembrane receptor protein/vitamin B12 transporter
MKGVFTAVLILVFSTAAVAANPTISGTITDPLGYAIPNATVVLLDHNKPVQTVTTDDSGRFRFEAENPGRYAIQADAKTFRQASSPEMFATSSRVTEVNLTLSPSVVVQKLVVTATGMPTPEAQTGASISVLDSDFLQTSSQLLQPFRNESGAQVLLTGQAGGTSYLLVRGGPSNANKVLIDGVPANDIGGVAQFSYLGSDGYDRVEFLRGPNGAVYGSDALASVLNVTTRKGSTLLPELTLSADGGMYGTYHQGASVGGAWKRLDYFSNYSRSDTRNSTPNSQFHSAEYAGNLGYQLMPGTELRATIRRMVGAFNAANAIALYGIPDDGVSREQDAAFSGVLENRVNDSWHNLVRYGGLRLRSQYQNFGPTGVPYDPFETGSPWFYLGAPVTLRGANGYAITPQFVAQIDPTLGNPGQAVFQSPGSYVSATLTNRDFIYVQTDYRFSNTLKALFGFRYENERGYTTQFGLQSTKRDNYSYIVQFQGGLRNRLFYSLGGGIENNAVFGVAAAPRATLAYYLMRPSSAGPFSGTRLRFNFGRGIKEPSITSETQSLYRLMQQANPQLIQQYGVHPFRAELSRSYDGGIEQQLLGGRAQVSLTYFHNQFDNQAEFVGQQYLAQLGVPQQVVAATGPLGGAVVNSKSYRAQGAEVELGFHINSRLAVRSGWTYTAAVVQHSFASSALQPAINPLFPDVQIGAYSPLVGARPFGLAPHTGFLTLDWNARRYSVSLSGSFISRRDDSDYLLDTNFGNTLLLPNHNLAPAYQKFDLHCSYQLSKRLTAYISAENLLNQHYQEVFGYPALPFTMQVGMKFRFGGESWNLN